MQCNIYRCRNSFLIVPTDFIRRLIIKNSTLHRHPPSRCMPTDHQTPRSARRILMMSDRAEGGPHMRILSNALAEECTILPSTDSLLGRLNQIDIRLRQLEKQQHQHQQQRRFPHLPENNYFIEDLQAMHLQCKSKSFSSTLHEVHLKGTLMERLHLLERRIHQLSHELDKGSSAVNSSAATKQFLTSDQTMRLQQIEREMKLQQDNVEPSSTREIGAGELQAQPSKFKIKDNRREAIIAVEKRANNIRQKEKRRLQAHTQLYKKWFPVGC